MKLILIFLRIIPINSFSSRDTRHEFVTRLSDSPVYQLKYRLQVAGCELQVTERSRGVLLYALMRQRHGVPCEERQARDAYLQGG